MHGMDLAKIYVLVMEFPQWEFKDKFKGQRGMLYRDESLNNN